MHAYIHIYTPTDGQTDGWKDGRMEGWKDGRMEGWKDGRKDRQTTNIHTYTHSDYSYINTYMHAYIHTSRWSLTAPEPQKCVLANLKIELNSQPGSKEQDNKSPISVRKPASHQAHSRGAGGRGRSP